MKLPQSQKIGVLTGDLVGSTEYPPELLEGILKGLQTLVIELSHRERGRLQANGEPLCYDSLHVFRGDGWQLVTPPSPSAVLTVATFIRTFVRFASDTIPCDSRVGISIGSHQGIDLKKSASYQGAVFTTSGLILEEHMKEQHQRMAFWSQPGHSELRFFASSVLLLDHLIRSWTPGQCQAVHYALLGYTQAETGKNWRQNLTSDKPISKAAVGQHLKAADYTTLERFLVTMESEEQGLE